MKSKLLLTRRFSDLTRRRRFWIAIFAFVSLSFVIWKGREILLEPVYPTFAERPTADCGVVLTGGPGRIRESFELLQQGAIQRLIVSGVNQETTISEIFPYAPFYPEVNLDHITLDKQSLTTFGNARFSLNIVEVLKCRDVVLITSQYHMPRAFSVFQSVFPESIPIKKYTIANLKSDSGLIDLGLEIIKSYAYFVLRFVNF